MKITQIQEWISYKPWLFLSYFSLMLLVWIYQMKDIPSLSAVPLLSTYFQIVMLSVEEIWSPNGRNLLSFLFVKTAASNCLLSLLFPFPLSLIPPVIIISAHNFSLMFVLLNIHSAYKTFFKFLGYNVLLFLMFTI